MTWPEGIAWAAGLMSGGCVLIAAMVIGGLIWIGRRELEESAKSNERLSRGNRHNDEY